MENHRQDERGATAVEYAVLLSLIATTVLLSVGFLGQTANDSLNDVSSAFPDKAIEDQSESTLEDKCGDKDSDDDPDCGRGND